jgi:C-terminal processing protease CtpA/Prc
MVDYGALELSNLCLVEKSGVAKTYGKGIMQTTYTFGWGEADAIRLTTAQIKWPKTDRCIHGVGLTPTDGCPTTPYVFDQDSEVYGGLRSLGIL